MSGDDTGAHTAWNLKKKKMADNTNTDGYNLKQFNKEYVKW